MPVLSSRRARTTGLAIAIVFCALGAPAAAEIDLEQLAGVVAGRVADETGAPIAGATVAVVSAGGGRLQGTAGEDGRFSIANVPAGACELTAGAPGFAARTVRCSSGSEAADVGEIRLRVAVNHISVDVTPSVVEIAEQQIHEQEQQRVLGIVPNFMVSFTPDAAPLNARQKFQLSRKAHVDPMQFAFVGFAAGLQQWRDMYPGFGDGASGYAKRYAAAYATVWTRSMVTQVLLPSVFRQDPRYFYKRTGSTRSRVVYAMSRTVIRKGDNGRWQPNYSGILGSLASGAISNFYYPEADRRGARLMLENTALGLVGGAVGHVAQEFLWARVTSHARRTPGK